MRSARWPTARNFCARGVPDFRKFCKLFARFLRNICVISMLDSRVILHSNAHRIRKELQRSSEVCATTPAEFTQLFVRAAAEKFQKLCNLFARVGRKNCVIPTLDACFFGSELNADSANSRRRREACTAHAGRVHAFFCVRGVPDFQNFCIFLQDFCTKFLG